MKKQLLIIATLFLSLAAMAEGPTVVKVSDLLAKAATYDQKQVKTSGAVSKFENRTSKAGNLYFVFKLKEKDKFVSIYGHGKLDKPLKDGDLAEVAGKFRKETTVGTNVFKNEIETTQKDVKLLKAGK